MKTNRHLFIMLSLGMMFVPFPVKAVTHTFTSNTTISASQVNQNFSELESSITALNTGVIPEGTNLYFTEPRVLATTLTGYTTGSPAPLSASDTFLQAIGKLEALITNLQSMAIQKTGGTMYGPLDMMGNNLTNLPSPILPSDAASKQYVDDLRYGLMTKWNDSTSFYCPMAGSGWVTPTLDATELNNLSFNAGTGNFSIPADGVYEIYLDAPYSAGDAYSMLKSRLSIFDGTNTHELYLPNNGMGIKRFLQNDQVKLEIYCSNTYSDQTITIKSARFVFGVRKISY